MCGSEDEGVITGEVPKEACGGRGDRRNVVPADLAYAEDRMRADCDAGGRADVYEEPDDRDGREPHELAFRPRRGRRLAEGPQPVELVAHDERAEERGRFEERDGRSDGERGRRDEQVENEEINAGVQNAYDEEPREFVEGAVRGEPVRERDDEEEKEGERGGRSGEPGCGEKRQGSEREKPERAGRDPHRERQFVVARIHLASGRTGCGSGRIRTSDALAGIPDFESGPFNRSGTLPRVP